MVNTHKPKSLLERELANAEFRRAYEDGYEAFHLEAQILHALEQKKWSYADLAKATNTSKSNVSRDLAAGGILNASFTRIGRMADALGMKLVGLLIPKTHVSFVLPQIEDLVRDSANAAFGKARFLYAFTPLTGPYSPARSDNATANSEDSGFTVSINNPIPA